MARKTCLIIGASRGLGFALAQEFLKRSWQVTGTFRGERAKLDGLATTSRGMLQIESLDVNEVAQIAALSDRLKDKSFDLLFVNAGVANGRYDTIGEVSTEEFVRVMVTNSLSVMRVVEKLVDKVNPNGMVGVMSSGQGSVADNEKGGFEVYRASKAALNTLMRSFVARRGGDRSFLLMAPGWIKTEMGGPEAKFTVEEVIPDIVTTIIAQEGRRGLRYLDRFGKDVRW